MPRTQREFAENGRASSFGRLRIDTTEGTLGVQISSADNGNNWVKVRLRGSKGTLVTGKSPRDGIGAIVSFTPKNGKKSRSPILGGSSYASQHALEQVFGLGTQSRGTIDVSWPGGKKNRLYDAADGEKILFPEIPCSYVGGFSNKFAYRSCVDTALASLRTSNVLTVAQAARFKWSAYKAWDDEH